MTNEEFKKLRKAARMTQAQFGERLGYSRQAVIHWEAGTHTIPDDVMDKLMERSLAPVTDAPKETAKEKRDRDAWEAKTIAHWLDVYSSLRAWPDIPNHNAAMRFIARNNQQPVPAIAYPAIVARWPDILTDPDGNYTLSKEESREIINGDQPKGN